MAGGLSDYAENKLMDLAFGSTSYSRPATVYLEPWETNAGEDGSGGNVPDSGYSARLAVTNNSTNFPAASGGVKTLATKQILYVAGAAETLTGVGIWDASSGGNLLGIFVPSASHDTESGKRVVIPAGTLSLTATGAWASAFANSLLDHLLGGGDYTPPATWYVGLLTASAEHSESGYARISKTNNTTNFPNASGGAKANGSEVSFGPAGANWAQSTRFGLYTASSGGTAQLVANLSDARTVLNTETATFAVGDLDLSLD